MSSVVISGDTSGTITIAAPAVAGSNTLTLPASTGTVMVNGPAFSAYSNANQNISSGTYTKIALQTKEFDTNSNFDNATNYRFTPTVAGYYQINGQCFCAGTALTYTLSSIYKNGSNIKIGSGYNGTAISNISSSVSSVVYFNGSTDYVELYAIITATSPNLVGGASFYTYFSGAMVRSA
jgi:hypothetical protein